MAPVRGGPQGGCRAGRAIRDRDQKLDAFEEAFLSRQRERFGIEAFWVGRWDQKPQAFDMSASGRHLQRERSIGFGVGAVGQCGFDLGRSAKFGHLREAFVLAKVKFHMGSVKYETLRAIA